MAGHSSRRNTNPLNIQNSSLDVANYTKFTMPTSSIQWNMHNVMSI